MTKKFDKTPIYILIGIIVGILVGLIFPAQAKSLKVFGDIFLNLLFTIVTPLVFVSLANAIGNMVDMKRLGKILSKTIIVFVVTGIIAGILIICVVKIFPPVTNAILSSDISSDVNPITISELLVRTFTVNDFYLLQSKSNMAPLLVFSIIFGIATSKVGRENNYVLKFLNSLNEIIMKCVSIIMLFAPIGLGSYFANLVSEYGSGLIGNYGRVLLIYIPTVLVYMIIFFPIYSYIAGGLKGVKLMLNNIMPPIITALGTQSSVATIPVNKKACDNIGVPEDISDIVLPMGATMHMDGSVISGIIKITVLFGLYGKQFEGFSVYSFAMLVAILSAFVLSGAPGGGLIGEVLIVNIFNFPMEAFPIVATIGILIDAPATMLNSSGDTIVSMIISRMVEGPKWLEGKK